MERYSKSSTSEVKFKLKSICHGAFKVTAIEKWGKNRVLVECKLLLHFSTKSSPNMEEYNTGTWGVN